MQLNQEAIDRFGSSRHPDPSACLISLVLKRGLESTGQELYYAVPVQGVVDPVTLYITRTLQNIQPISPLQSIIISLTI